VRFENELESIEHRTLVFDEEDIEAFIFIDCGHLRSFQHQANTWQKLPIEDGARVA
jgi:hypothetical protein